MQSSEFASEENTFSRGTVLFVGCLATSYETSGVAYSEAANQVQLEIIDILAEEQGGQNLMVASMTPLPAFPKAPLLRRGLNGHPIREIGFLNLPIVKHITFSLGLLIHLLSLRPQTVIVYNSYFFQNIVLLFYRWFANGTKLAVLVQDVLTPGRGWRAIQRKLDRYSVRFLSNVDLFLPISEYITADFGITSPSFVIKGGVTRKIVSTFAANASSTRPINRAVFAGGLEPHNGIDRLLKAWEHQNIDLELHVFGKGALASIVQAAAKTNPRIIFHGFTPHEKIQEFVASSKFLFVLRYDEGIESKYFFPSKFWEAVGSNCVVLCNEFIGFPEDLRPYCMILEEELQNLDRLLKDDRIKVPNIVIQARRRHVIDSHAWDAHVRKILAALQ